METINILFLASCVLCTLSLTIFNTQLIKGIGITEKTVPYLLFSIIYFIAVPVLNIYQDTYVQKSLFQGDPINDMVLLNIVNVIGLSFATLGVAIGRSSRNNSYFVRDNIDYKSAKNLVTLCKIIIPITLTFGLHNNYFSGSNSGSDGENQDTIFKFLLIESTPLLFCWATTTYYTCRNIKPSTLKGGLIIITHIIIIIALNSTRGSRVAMLLQILIGFQIYSKTIFNYKPVHLVLAIIAMYLTLPVYAYYKYGGQSALVDYITKGIELDHVKSYNDPIKFIVGDIGRSDIQAPILKGIIDDKISPSYWPETYTSGLLLIIPGSYRPEFVRSKIIVGADAQIRLDPSAPLFVNKNGEAVSTRIYALLGEGLLNFGIISIPFIFIIFGYVSRKALIRAHSNVWPKNLTAPFFSLAPIFILFYDFDNIVFQTITIWGIPIILLKISKKIKVFKSNNKYLRLA